jgi:hypothetical protein
MTFIIEFFTVRVVSLDANESKILIGLAESLEDDTVHPYPSIR